MSHYDRSLDTQDEEPSAVVELDVELGVTKIVNKYSWFVFFQPQYHVVDMQSRVGTKLFLRRKLEYLTGSREKFPLGFEVVA